MTQQLESYWPQIQVVKEKAPVTILREQGHLLAKATGNNILGVVESDQGEQGELIHHFYLLVPSLGDYRYHLFSISHYLPFFPLRFSIGEALQKELDPSYVQFLQGRSGSGNYSVEDSSQFLDFLKEVLQTKHTSEVLEGLLAQAQ